MREANIIEVARPCGRASRQAGGRGRRVLTCVALAAVGLLCGSAGAAVVNFDTAGYAPGALAGQPGTGPTWSDSAGAFVVASGAGVSGSNALQTGTNAASGNSASYTPAASDYSSTFAAKPALAYSFQVSATGASQTVRVFLGSASGNATGSAAGFQLNTVSSGTGLSIKSSDGSTTLYPNVTENAFHTISGVIDYTAKTYTVLVDNNATTAASYPFTATLNGYGSILILQRSAATNGASFTFDNFSLDSTTVPEPATLGGLATAAAGLLRRRTRRA